LYVRSVEIETCRRIQWNGTRRPAQRSNADAGWTTRCSSFGFDHEDESSLSTGKNLAILVIDFGRG
jgi:hypothetical protein